MRQVQQLEDFETALNDPAAMQGWIEGWENLFDDIDEHIRTRIAAKSTQSRQDRHLVRCCMAMKVFNVR